MKYQEILQKAFDFDDMTFSRDYSPKNWVYIVESEGSKSMFIASAFVRQIDCWIVVFREYNKPMVFHKDSALITEFEQKKCY